MTTVIAQVIVYGSCSRDPDDDDRFGPEQRRVEITLNPTIHTDPTTMSMDQRKQWIEGFWQRIRPDMKHNRNWQCEFCEKPARETVWMWASWMKISPPRLKCYIHNICNAARGPCSEQLDELNSEMGRITGCPLNGLAREAKSLINGQQKFPLSSSCAVCHNEMKESRKNLKQCSKCELTRYCSVGCQRADWKRHKECCQVVTEVEWHWA
ncbi:hypothetical protein DFH06DRAFT_1204952 [Mycena polygramma]|nr:hypothetical protein DFH06DRAFT_1204952 [Mycena polygramma]